MFLVFGDTHNPALLNPAGNSVFENCMAARLLQHFRVVLIFDLLYRFFAVILQRISFFCIFHFDYNSDIGLINLD